jgi:hypothetical protein
MKLAYQRKADISYEASCILKLKLYHSIFESFKHIIVVFLKDVEKKRVWNKRYESDVMKKSHSRESVSCFMYWGLYSPD